jgi:hypothetical protein
METKLKDLNLIAEKELREVNGGDPALLLAGLGILVGYYCWAFQFIYTMAKD